MWCGVLTAQDIPWQPQGELSRVKSFPRVLFENDLQMELIRRVGSKVLFKSGELLSNLPPHLLIRLDVSGDEVPSNGEHKTDLLARYHAVRSFGFALVRAGRWAVVMEFMGENLGFKRMV
jgi:hypothetical protein